MKEIWNTVSPTSIRPTTFNCEFRIRNINHAGGKSQILNEMVLNTDNLKTTPTNSGGKPACFVIENLIINWICINYSTKELGYTIGWLQQNRRNFFSIRKCGSCWNRPTFYKTEVVLESCLTVHLHHKIIWNANLMQQGNFIDVFLARHISGTYAHHQEH